MDFNKNFIYLNESDVNYLAISCLNESAERIIKAWLLERNIVFEGNIPYWIVIPYGMAALNMTAVDLAKELTKATKIETEILKCKQQTGVQQTDVIRENPSPRIFKPRYWAWDLPKTPPG